MDVEYERDNVLGAMCRHLVELSWSVKHPLRDASLLTSSTRGINEVISSQQPQFMGYLCTLRIKYSMALSSFFSFAKTIPYLSIVS